MQEEQPSTAGESLYMLVWGHLINNLWLAGRDKKSSLVLVVKGSDPNSDYSFSWDISHKCLHFAGWRYCFSPWQVTLSFNSSEFLDSSQAKVGKPTAGLTEVPHLGLTLLPCECVSGRDPSYHFMIWFYIELHMPKAVLGCCCPAGHNGYWSLGEWTQFPLKFPNNSRLYWWRELG